MHPHFILDVGILYLKLFTLLNCVTIYVAEESDGSSIIFGRIKSCLQRSKVAHDTDLSKLQILPSKDSTQHYHELLKATSMHRQVPVHSAAGYNGPWIENMWIEHFMKKPLAYFHGMIPLFLQWTDIHCYEFEDENTKNKSLPDFRLLPENITKLLRNDIVYVILHQDDQGLTNRLAKWNPNILSISAGGFGHVAIPLIKGDLNYSEPPKKFEHDVAFYGSIRPRLSRSKFVFIQR